MHTTRIKMWAKYRAIIYNNIELHDEVIASNEKLALLYKRLLKKFPQYEKLFKVDKKQKIKFSEINEPNKYDLKEIGKLIDALNLDEVDVDLNYLDKIKFSTEELSTIISDLKSWEPKGETTRSYKKNSVNIEINKTKKVKYNV